MKAMPRRALAPFGLIFVTLVIAGAAPAQQPPPRPRLSREADTNDAVAYFRWGLGRLERQPAQAATAFYWAGRLDPTSPQTLYAQAIALLMSDGERLVLYLRDDPEALRSPVIRRADSLLLRAWIQDPLLQTGLDEALLIRFVRGLLARRMQLSEVSDGDIARSLDTTLAEAAPALRARLSYSRGNYREALQYLARAIREARRDHSRLHAARARSFWHLGQLDSARITMLAAIAAARAEDTTSLQPGFVSKALLEYSMGRILEQMRDVGGARAAYERALVEDLSHFPSHVRLAILALQVRDTARAIQELERAGEITNEDYLSQALLGTVLGRSGRHADALVRLSRATTIEPWASGGWLLLAQERDAAADVPGAERAYERFLAVAPRTDPSRDPATRQLARLKIR